MKPKPLAVKIGYASVFTALGIVLAHTFFFSIFGTLAFPGQHLVNAVAGVMLGPWWASLVAALVGTYRNAVGIGTLFAYPGGIPGALVVGFAYRLLRRRYGVKASLAAALLEPVGTVIIGGTTSLLVIAPVINPAAAELVTQLGVAGALIQFYTGWALSSVPGAIIGYSLLVALHRFQAVKIE
ncbi:MAG TPA: energy coupling factor transporter S component ThiW [Candidatus Caldiarchaeum subterraneum]|uniref:Energy coupling factor transporter S component ThiW n=1 Tax=Caldiarchaeum subterraneum TaxID=311458 RepID=A0A833EBX8_CALS0|nr:energy coupling factor transporter S component ThiW [Aigarchaeota archaeon]HIQ29285.1 energy coupling factor transporter S component ThiW [Candidatus Caldarchaeum subterraneum]